jgi:transcriptional regulator with XRE-family HTH domain
LPLTTYLREREHLAEALRNLRAGTGLSGNRFAQRLGWVQSRVSKIETGKQLPTEADIEAWAAVAAAPPDVVRELLDNLRRARVEYATWQDNYRAAGGAAAKQADIAALEAQAVRLAKFQPVMIPSQLQTAEYARELLHSASGPGAWGADDADIIEMIAIRMQRQQILYQPRKHVRIVILEAALRTRVTSPAAMAGQLDRLIALGGVPALDLGIIPFGTQVPVYPLSGFVLFDDHLVIVETLTGEQQLSDPDAVSRYLRWFDLLHEAALHGRDAVPLIQRALTELSAGTDDVARREPPGQAV